MSGGSLNYFYSSLELHAGDFDDKELDDLVKDLADLFFAREWYLSGDTNQGQWREARDKFKTKWFSGDGRRERIEQYLHQLKSDLLDSFGFGNYCRDCADWSPTENGSDYGWCKHVDDCLMHRSECCGKWRKSEDNDGKCD